ncbi:hypothetical protein Vid5_gp92 [Pantoea phage vB_PagS_Vid5]|uniref:Uncharacterized protein n=1 Tax=Pantoea phage vB_PagS_Vid5 TaxID=2099652 RepID=A0A2P1CKR1_9CAUD|nr:hypothetical protein FDJ45_gp063 [Pantoea phage vB_PagS_Vid5]AVJ51847.1 hypothetical protein Vid5_gp92 [Pantoea phage vB_PagS_Vid5]
MTGPSNALGLYIVGALCGDTRLKKVSNMETLLSLPGNTFRGIYDECDRCDWTGVLYNGVYYSEGEVYFASLQRDEGYEILL